MTGERDKHRADSSVTEVRILQRSGVPEIEGWRETEQFFWKMKLRKERS